MAKRNENILDLMSPAVATSSLDRTKGSNGETHGGARKTAGARTKLDNVADIVGAASATTLLGDPSGQQADVAQATKPEIKKRKKDMPQLSVYLEPSLYNRLRECAHVQRTKMHPIVVEGILLALAKREGQRE